LDGARAVLLKHGYAGFTTRRVAAAAAMRPGNLSYHFPNKRELLRALIARLMEEYSERLAAFIAEPGVPFGQELRSLITWLISDAVAEETVRTFRELWAMALHDTVIRKAVDDFYDDVMENVATVLRRRLPGITPVAAREFVQVVALLSEGTTILYGTRRNRVVPHERILTLLPALLGDAAPQFAEVMCS
jgi:AcrR family transcriptional regulator